VTFDLYIPEKFQELFALHSDCYDARIKLKNGKYYVYIGLSIPEIEPIHGFNYGCIGIDTNPDGLAVVEIGPDGNLLEHKYFQNNRIQFARSNKRLHDIQDLACQVVDYAVQKQKGIVLEDLKFNLKKPSKSRKFNRMRHNFIYAQLLQAIERRAIQYRIAVKKINPAFTSIAGILKSQEQYSLNRHTAAAFIIARRGLGIMEKIRVKLEPLENEKLNLAGRGFKIALTKKAYSYFRILYQVFEVETPELTAPCLIPQMRNPFPQIGLGHGTG
jgi:IS605 OrfB family transposase